MKRIALCAFVFIFLAALASAQEPNLEKQIIKMFVQDAAGRLSFVDAVQTESGEVLIRPVPVGTVCNGGSCATTGGTVLNCPTSGGPVCKAHEVCTCTCVLNTDGTWSPKNQCVEE